MTLIKPASRQVSDASTGMLRLEWDAYFRNVASRLSDVEAIGGLTPADGNVIVGDGTTWVAESGATARASLGAAASGANTDITSLSPNGVMEIRPVEYASNPRLRLGQSGHLNTNGQAGLDWEVGTNGSLYIDHKTVSGGSTYFRCGAGAEYGYARYWMTVTCSNGTVTFDQSDVNIGTYLNLHYNQINVQAGSAYHEFAINYSGYADAPLSLYNGSGTLKAVVHPNGYSYFNGGNVGVGTSAPAGHLHVKGTGWPVIVAESTSGWSSLALKGNASQSCVIHYGDSTDGTNEVRFGRYDSNFTNWQANPVRFDMDAPDGSFFVNGAGTTVVATLSPSSDNTYPCGWSGGRWTSVWAANGTIQTSDAREKADVGDSSLGLEFIKALRPVSYRWKVGGNVEAGPGADGKMTFAPVPGKRTHWGLLAQEVKAVADKLGVDFGGHIITNMADPESSQGLRYDQFVAPLIKAVQELAARVEALEAQS